VLVSRLRLRSRADMLAGDEKSIDSSSAPISVHLVGVSGDSDIKMYYCKIITIVCCTHITRQTSNRVCQ